MCNIHISIATCTYKFMYEDKSYQIKQQISSKNFVISTALQKS